MVKFSDGDALADERAHLVAVHAALARTLDTARHRVATGAAVAGDRYTAETLGRMLRTHVKQLVEEPPGPPFFGRLTFGDGEHAGQRYHLGRRHVTDAHGRPLVLDWRAPVSRAFYQARAADPLGVTVRRRYGWSGPTVLTGFEDEHLGTPGDGLGRLVAEEIARPRVGPMRDIVATIQPDQDDLVRAGLDVSVCVQGGPGTGKTAVGLHRAAYLLYAHRRRLERSGVLVVGPHRVFLDYISAVLPALGEGGVVQHTPESLLDGPPPTGLDTPEALAVKHDARMAEVLARALRRRVTVPDAPLAVPDGSYRWRIPAEALARLVVSVRDQRPRYGVGRDHLRARLVDLMRRQAERRGETPGHAWEQRMGRCRPVRDFLDRHWPAVKPAELVAAVLADPADPLLTDAEQAAIRRARTRWTAADALLLDEAADLITPRAGVGHIIVDEAQDLSPMQCRANARRSRHGSLTVLGDLAQGTTPWAAKSWAAQLAHLGRPDAAVIPLTAGFRVPGAVLKLANRLLPALGADVPPTRSVRADGTVRLLPDADPAAVVAEALAHEGSIAVIAADVDRLAVPPSPRVTLLPAALAKGLEYDHVIVVEPAEIVAAEPRGLHRLYVVLTRAVSRLDVVHSGPLPGPLSSTRHVPQ